MEEINTSQSKNGMEFNGAIVLNAMFKARILVILCCFIFLILGILVAMLTPKEYTASAIILPQVSAEKGLGKKFGTFASLVGLKLGESSGNDILPTLYPIIVKSAPFQRKMLATPLTIAGQKHKITLSEYLKNVKKEDFLSKVKGNTIGLPAKIIGSLSRDEIVQTAKTDDSLIYQISQMEKGQIDFLMGSLAVTFNDLEGYIDIRATMPEPMAAAELTKSAQDVLQEFIIEYNVQKAKDELGYIEKRLDEARATYLKKKSSVGNYRDRNQNYIFSATQNRLDYLQEENDVAFNMYNQLAGQTETAKLQVKKDTPIFTILKPVTVPTESSAPNKALIVLEFLFVGLILSIIIVLSRKYLPEFRRYIRNSE